MYEKFYQLARRPFLAIPVGASFFPSNAHEHARQQLARAIERAEGPGLLIGPAGSGKTLLLQVLAQQFRGQFRVALLASTRLVTRRALLQNILFELGLPYRDLEEGELRLSLIDHLSPGPACPNGLLLLIDEAHHLPIRLLEEVRMITNLVRDGQPRVRLVLAGGGALEEQFASPKLESLNQRVAARCYLSSLGREETMNYVRWQIAQAGGDPAKVFSDDALRATYTATDGIPRLVNQLCDHALLLGVTQNQHQLQPSLIAEAWADLQQLPTPFSDQPLGRAPATSIIEFGQLGDEPETARTTTQTSLVEATTAPTASVATSDLSVRLDSLERAVVQAGQDWPAEDHLAVAGAAEPEQFQPQGSFETEVELIFHGPHNPFTEKYEYEEIVLDPYAALDTLSKRPKVSSTEGRELSSLLAQASQSVMVETAPSVAAVGKTEAQPTIAPQSPAEEEPDIVLPPKDLMHEEPDIVRPPLSVLSRDPLAADDRDILLIEDEEESTPAPAAGRARRQEYRQLFAKLRRG